ncbi:MAG: TIGR00289 family protein [Candidatus Marsarchaeota archaeon]|jgi:ABC transporter with metal-binding/Fe-S-binding domain ATP-binding protein|nr:TIGR00289 family protein [Candidatus Marsarchaeota archaeon]MCL5419062.1 TIGR00289 family protein [Candidatus Marsarchaeota archaeon]
MKACLFSGGKDSTLALHKASAEKSVELLITMLSQNDDSYMFHKANIGYTKLQAEAMGIEQKIFETKGEKEAELLDLEKALVENNVTELVTGATASEYQKSRIDQLCKAHGITHIAPLWHTDPLEELRELCESYDAIVTKVAAEGFDDSYLGARIDGSMVERLKLLNQKYGVNMLFEGGEAESFVLDAPMFKKRIEIKKAHKEWDGFVGLYVIDEAVLSAKQ